jgi:hypothetical protein
MNDTIYFNEGKNRYRYDRRKWVSDHVWSKLMTAVNNGLTRKEFQKILGNAKVCRTIIEESEKKEELLKIFPENSWFWYPKIKPSDIIEKERELNGKAPNLVKRKIPLSKFLEGEEYLEDSEGITVSPTVMRRIVKFFLDKTGRYIQIQKGKTERGREEIYVIGEIAKSEKPRSDFILLDKYSQKRKR